jgi:U3 small nucleolar RNA-associated protein 18
MGKHARKRQRKDKPAHKSFAPLGTVLLDDDADKDDEERRLESLLFGKPLVSGRRSKVTAIEDVSEEGDGVDATAAELEGMLDSDVSYPLAFPRNCLTPLLPSFFLWTMARRPRRV